MLTFEHEEPTVTREPDSEAAAAVNAWLRMELGRRLTIAVLEPRADGCEACAQLCERLALYPEVRVLRRTLAATQDRAAVLAQLGELAREDADALLVWVSAAALVAREGASSAERLWAAEVLACADELNLRDRCFTALIGEGMTRQDARKAGYEDGFSAGIAPAALVRALGREALDREEYRRRGSSPPCYL